MNGVDVPCAEIVELVTDYFEGALPAETTRLFEEHLAACGKCARYVEQIRATSEALGTVSDETLSDDAWTELRNAFRGLGRRSGS